MKKKLLLGLSSFVLLIIIATLRVNKSSNNDNLNMSDVMLSNLDALADPDEGTNKCPGGSCNYSDSDYQCSACCPEGKSPRCNAIGCDCW